MKLLFVSQYYTPEPFLISEITEELVKRGHEVTVLTGLPNYPSGVIAEGYKDKKLLRETIGGVEVVRAPIIPRGKNKLQLLINYFSFMRSANRVGKTLDKTFDLVISYELTPIFQVSPAVKIAERLGVKIMMYNLDLAPMAGSGVVGKIPGFSTYYKKFSKWAMNACDLVAVSSPSFIQYNHEVNGVPVEKMVYLPQHASDLMLGEDMSAQENGIADFMFAGNIAGGTGLDTIVEAAALLSKEEKFRIHIVGDGSYLETLKEKVKNEKLEDYFLFHGRYPMKEMPNLYRQADALLITLRPGQITIPAKLQNYMTTGKPIFGAMDGSGKDLIAEAECGLCVGAGDSHGLYENMKDYIRSPQKYEPCGKSGQDYFRAHFTLKHYVDKLLELANTLV